MGLETWLAAIGLSFFGGIVLYRGIKAKSRPGNLFMAMAVASISFGAIPAILFCQDLGQKAPAKDAAQEVAVESPAIHECRRQDGVWFSGVCYHPDPRKK